MKSNFCNLQFVYGLKNYVHNNLGLGLYFISYFCKELIFLLFTQYLNSGRMRMAARGHKKHLEIDQRSGKSQWKVLEFQNGDWEATLTSIPYTFSFKNNLWNENGTSAPRPNKIYPVIQRKSLKKIHMSCLKLDKDTVSHLSIHAVGPAAKLILSVVFILWWMPEKKKKKFINEWLDEEL